MSWNASNIPLLKPLCELRHTSRCDLQLSVFFYHATDSHNVKHNNESEKKNQCNRRYDFLLSAIYNFSSLWFLCFSTSQIRICHKLYATLTFYDLYLPTFNFIFAESII
jgi:hypothetical protein